MFEALSQHNSFFICTDRQKMISVRHITQKKYGHKFSSTNYRKRKNCFITYKISHFFIYFLKLCGNFLIFLFMKKMSTETTSNNFSLSFPSKCCMYTVFTKKFFCVGLRFFGHHPRPFRNQKFPRVHDVFALYIQHQNVCTILSCFDDEICCFNLNITHVKHSKK